MEIRYYEGVNVINLGWKYEANPHVKFISFYIIRISHLKAETNWLENLWSATKY